MFQIVANVLEAAASGLAGALCMTLFEIPFWRKWGMGAVAEWQVNSVMVSMFFRKRTPEKSPPYPAIAMHLVHGIILGVIFFAALRYFLPLNQLSTVTGVAVFYSILLWIISPLATRNFFESRGNFRMTSLGLAVSFGSHVIYGLILGLLVTQLV